MLKKLSFVLAASMLLACEAASAQIALYPPSFGSGVLDATSLNQTITAVNNLTGNGTPQGGTFSTLAASGAVSGAGFTARFAVPGPIGSTTASTGAFTTLSASGAVNLTGLGTDSGKTSATVCEDTTSHLLYFGSGAAGVCAGTSSLRFKHDVEPLSAGLSAVLALEPISYKLNADHGDPNATLYGFSAEQGGSVLPQLMKRDAQGAPNTFDYLGVVPVLVRAIQEQQAEIEQLRRHASR